jgi:DNA-binding CsgD family transcriptional regulator
MEEQPMQDFGHSSQESGTKPIMPERRSQRTGSPAGLDALPDQLAGTKGLADQDVEQAAGRLSELEQLLREQAGEMEEMRAALKVLIKSREEDRSALERCVMANVDKLIEPFLSRLEKSRLNDQQQFLVQIIRRNLEELTSDFAGKCSSRLGSLTPAEVQIANLIKLGKRTKEIAQILRLSPGTISIHRRNIRKKLELTHRKVNLQAILSR